MGNGAFGSRKISQQQEREIHCSGTVIVNATTLRWLCCTAVQAGQEDEFAYLASRGEMPVGTETHSKHAIFPDH